LNPTRNPEATGIWSLVYTVHIHVVSWNSTRMFLKKVLE
jgi:hypothetical protein